MKKIMMVGALCLLHSYNAVAATPALQKYFPVLFNAPLPTTCVTGEFIKDGSCWYEVSLRLTNNCGTDVDFQNSSITFNNGDNLNVGFWGEFAPLSYPINTLQITSQVDPAGGFLASLSLQFPTYTGARSVLSDKQSFLIKYGTSSPSYNPSSIKVYINGAPPVVTGEIDITNTTPKPAKVSQTYALVDIMFNGQKVNTVQVPWGEMLPVPNLAPGVYSLQPQTVLDSDQNAYQGSAVPSSVTVVANTKINSSVSYQLIVQPGAINVAAPVLPAALTGYTSLPVVTFTRADTGASVSKSVAWNGITSVSNLDNNVLYQVSTPVITFNSNRCVGSFNPSSLLSRATTPLTTQLTYTCSSIVLDKIVLNIAGVPCDVTKVSVELKPSDGSATVQKWIAINKGSGADTVSLTDGVSYSVRATDLDGYSIAYLLQPLVAKPDVLETIIYTPHALKKSR